MYIIHFLIMKLKHGVMEQCKMKITNVKSEAKVFSSFDEIFLEIINLERETDLYFLIDIERKSIKVRNNQYENIGWVK